MDISPSLLSALADEASVCFVLDDALRIRYANPAWRAWGDRDGGVEPRDPQVLVGRPYLDFVVGPLRGFLEGKLRAALRLRHGLRGLLLCSECNSPTHFRALTTHVVP